MSLVSGIQRSVWAAITLSLLVSPAAAADKLQQFLDAIKGEQSKPSPAAEDEWKPVPNSKWLVNRTSSALTDKRTVAWRISSENEVADEIGRPARSELALICNETTTRLLFTVNSYMGNSQQIEMLYRLDKGKISKANVTLSADGMLFGFAMQGDSIPFMQSLIPVKQLIIAVTPYNEGRREAIFDVEDIEPAIVDVRTTCKW